jgi:uncharacterized SAM-binding protein YcdF (DUF218 family)
MTPQESIPLKKRRWRRWALLILLLLAVVLLAAGPVLRAMGAALVHEDAPWPAEVIVVLAGSPVVRGLAGANRFKEGLAPLVYLSRGGLERADLVAGMDLGEAGDWGLLHRLLVLKGVPPDRIWLDPVFVDSTIAEATRVREFLADRKMTSMILITSRFHSGRAHETFQRILGPGVQIISLPSPYDPFDPDGWWKDRATAKRVFFEYVKGVFMFWESLFQSD